MAQIRWFILIFSFFDWLIRSENGEAGGGQVHLPVSTSDSLRPIIANGGSQVQSQALTPECANLGGGLGATGAWSIMPGSTEGEFQPSWIYIMLIMHHYMHPSKTVPCQGHKIFMHTYLWQCEKQKFLYFLDILTFLFRQNWASFVQFSDKSESIFLSSSLLLPITLHDSLMLQPMNDDDHPHDILTFMILWSLPPWFFDASTHDEDHSQDISLTHSHGFYSKSITIEENIREGFNFRQKINGNKLTEKGGTPITEIFCEN